MIGIDIVKIERVEKLLQKYPEKALRRFLCEEEIALVHSPQTAAGFFAAKEAVSKALGTGIGAACSFFDIRIYKNTNGTPGFTLSKKIVERFAVTNTALSITHDGAYAIAVAVITHQNIAKKPLFH